MDQTRSEANNEFNSLKMDDGNFATAIDFIFRDDMPHLLLDKFENSFFNEYTFFTIIAKTTFKRSMINTATIIAVKET